MEYSVKTVILTLINLEDKTFVITTDNNSEALQKSISRVGLLNLPYLLFVPSRGYYRIVCGFRRIQVLKALGWHQVPARIIPEDSDAKESFLMSVYDNLSHRAFNVIEQAAIAVRLLHYFSEEIVVKDYFPLMGLPPTVKTLVTMRLLASLEPEMQTAVVVGNVCETAAVKLAQLTAEERRAFINLFSRVHLSARKQEEIIVHCMDCAVQQGTPCSTVLQDGEIQNVLAQDTLTRSQKGDRVRELLKKKHHPRLTRCEERFVHLRRKLRLPPGMELSPPPFFEGGRYCIRLEFEQAEDLRQQIKKLHDLADATALHDILEDM
jgi:hypothetical protein